MKRLPNVNPSDTTKYPNGIGNLAIGAVNKNSKILLYNMSPLNIDLDFFDGNTDVIHAWEANYWVLSGETPDIEFQIDADSLNVSNPPISRLFMTLYGANEIVPGTYPMSIMHQTTVGNQGGVTSSVGTLSQETNAAGFETVDIGTSTNNKLIDIFNDGHFIWSVLQGAAAHQIMKGQSAGNPLQLGQAGDIVEMLGKLLIDQVPTATASPPTGTGNINIYEMTFGQIKLAVVLATNFQNTSASKFTLALPTAFTNWAIILSGRTTQTEILAGGSSGTVQTLNVVTGLAAGANGSISSQTVIFQYNFAEQIGAFDTLRFQASNGTLHANDGLIIVGV